MYRVTDSSSLLSSCTSVLAIAAIFAAAGTGEEIIVTAQKREQTLMEIPQSVTVLDGELLARQQADNFKDYLALIPGLSLETGAPGQTRITLRGINTGGVATTVGVYADEVPFGSSTGLANGAVLSGEFDTFDVARLEVLRGPQGTLYGASSLGGVLRLVTNPPSMESFEARVQAGVEDVELTDDIGWSAKGMINLPVSDSFALRASGFYRFDDGFINSIGNNPIPSLLDPTINIVQGTRVAENINEHKTFGGRVSGLFDAGEGLSVRLTALLQNIENRASDTFEGDPDTYAPLYGGLVTSQYHAEPNDLEYRILSGTVDWDIGAGSLLSSTSYGTFEHDFQADIALTFGPTATFVFGDPTNRPLSVIQLQVTSTDKFTQEFRFTSPDDESFEWLVGAFYTREESEIDQDFFMVEAGTDVIAEDLPLFARGLIPSDYEEYAAFGNATWYLADRFDLTFGARASRNDQAASQLLDLSSLGGGVVTFDEVGSSENVFTWSVAPRFQFDDGSAVYARIATGYRPGGPNVLPPGAPPETPASYDADRLTSYEIGLKGDWLDNRLSLDAAAYWLDWEDIQLFAQVANVGFNANGGTAVSKGVEFTAMARPSDNLTFSLNGAWTDAYLTQDTPPVVGGLDGDPLPWVPEWTTTVGVDYEWSIGGDMTAWVGGDLSYTGERTADFGFRDATGALRELSSYETVDLRAGIDTGRWSLEAYAQNLTDERGITSIGGYDPTGVPNGAATVSIIRPRAVGLTVGVEF
jgi:outer membrane receptor protein involved in Fe transport